MSSYVCEVSWACLLKDFHPSELCHTNVLRIGLIWMEQVPKCPSEREVMCALLGTISGVFTSPTPISVRSNEIRVTCKYSHNALFPNHESKREKTRLTRWLKCSTVTGRVKPRKATLSPLLYTVYCTWYKCLASIRGKSLTVIKWQRGLLLLPFSAAQCQVKQAVGMRIPKHAVVY